MVLAALSLFARPAEAQRELPTSKFGLISGLRQNIGPLGDAYRFGGVIGVGAGVQPLGIGSAYDLGVAWEVVWGWSGASDPELVDTTLRTLEMAFGFRLRRALGEGVPKFLVASGGMILYRTNVPVPPRAERLYTGPYAGIGYDHYLAGRYLVGIEARYGLVGGGPGSLSLLVSFSFGSP